MGRLYNAEWQWLKGPSADATLSTALAIDYDGLIIPAGKRHIDTPENEAHAMGIAGFPPRDMLVSLPAMRAMLQLVDGAWIVHMLRLKTRPVPIVDGRLITVAAARDELAELEAFDAAVGSIVDESYAA